MTNVRRENAAAFGGRSPIWTDWLSRQVGDLGPFTWTPRGGGDSTVMVSSEAGRWILRAATAPGSTVSSDDLTREARVLRALAEQPVPAPRVVADSAHGLGAPGPCLLMEHGEGVRLTDSWPTGWPRDGSAAGPLAESAVDALASLHAVDWVAAGVADLRQPGDFLERQVARWRGVYEESQVRDLPLFEQLSAWLAGNRPEVGDVTLIHGNFHLGNCLSVPGPPAQVSAIVNWTCSTIGDPLTDLGHMLALWGSDRAWPRGMRHGHGMFQGKMAPTRAEIAHRYTAISGRSTQALPFYMVLALFKVAALMEGHYARLLCGEAKWEHVRAYADDVPHLLKEAAQHADIL